MKNIEIEKKFLVDHKKWQLVPKGTGILFDQGYLSIDKDKVVRVRAAGNKGYITVKGASESMVRPEYEYVIPYSDAVELICNFSIGRVKKLRYNVEFGGRRWEVDEFQGDNFGLILAEIELENSDCVIDYPDWILHEVTGDQRYYNSYLSHYPFNAWSCPIPYNEKP